MLYLPTPSVITKYRYSHNDTNDYYIEHFLKPEQIELREDTTLQLSTERCIRSQYYVDRHRQIKRRVDRLVNKRLTGAVSVAAPPTHAHLATALISKIFDN